MISRSVRYVAQAGVVAVVAAGAFTMTQLDKAVSLSLDGQTTSVHVLGSTVADLLAKQNVAVGSHDLVSPSVDQPLNDGQTVVVRYGRKLTVTVDGKTRDYYTTATTVDAALAQLGIRADTAKLSVSRSEPLGRSGLAMTITSPRHITVNVDGGARSESTTVATVADVLQQLEISLGPTDKVTPAPESVVSEGLAITVNRVQQKTSTQTQPVAFATVRQDDAGLAKGSTKVQTPGVAGQQTLTFTETWVDGLLAQRVQSGTAVTSAPVNQVVAVGTKAAPAPARASAPAAPRAAAPAPAPRAAAPSGAGLNLANAAMWDRIARCESTGNWHINTGNGYYGGLQFDSRTWLGAGGGDFAPRADLASREQQITVANRIYASRGLSPWGCAGAA